MILINNFHMGLLTETARLHPKSERTGASNVFLCAIGKESNKFKIIDNKSAYGKDSPFNLIRELGGKIGVLDLEEQLSMTFYHHVEEMNNVDYRYHKDFEGIYVDEFGVSSEKTYSIFVRDLDRNIKTNSNPLVNCCGKMVYTKEIDLFKFRSKNYRCE